MNRGLLSPGVFSTLSWLLLLGAMVVLAGVGYDVYKRHIAPREPQHFHFGSVQQSAEAGRVELTEIIDAHIFGVVPVAKKKIKVLKPEVVEAPETRLNLTLTGVITASNPLHRRAMIEVKRGQTSVVQVGAEIGKTGATLNAVFADYILIEHRGKLEKLVLERSLLKLSDRAAQNKQTISALNINIAEFEALAEVDPSDLDISRLLPPNSEQQPPQPENSAGQDQQNIQQPNIDSEEATELEQKTEPKQLLQNEASLYNSRVWEKFS